MKVALAGAGDVARYLCEELPIHGHEVVVLTRSQKDYLEKLDVVQRITDYSAEDLNKHLEDCDALISVILDYTPANVDLHLALLEACKASPKCKRFIPSEFGGNIEDYPDQPMFYYPTHEPIRKALREQQDVKWTLVCNGWLVDYLLPAERRYTKEPGDAWPVDSATKTMTIYGKGALPVDFTPTRDLARAVAALLDHDDWEPYTYISSDRLTWQGMFDVVSKREPGWTKREKSLTASVQQIVAAESEWSVVVAQFELFSHSGAAGLPPEKVKAHREKYFKDVHFRGIEELLNECEATESGIL